MNWEMRHEKTDEDDWTKIKLPDGGNRFRNKHRNRAQTERSDIEF